MQSSRMRRRIAATLLASASTLATLLAAPEVRAQTVGTLRVGENYRLGEVPAGRGRDIPGIVANPGNPLHIVEVERDILAQDCRYNVSTDGGATWSGGALRPPADFPPPGSPVTLPSCSSFEGSVEFGTGNNVYVTWGSARAAGQGTSALVARSTDGGRTYPPAVVAQNNPQAGAPSYGLSELAVLPGGGTGGQDRVAVASLAGGRPMVSVSNDSGVTWSTPVDASNNLANCCAEASAPAIAPDGTIYVSYRRNGFEAFVAASRSTNGGSTWTVTPEVAPVRGYIDELGAVAGAASTWPRMTVNHLNGHVYLVYMQGPPINARSDHFIHPDVDVLFVKSTNTGTTWTAPVRVNDDPIGTGAPATGPAQRHPEVSVAPNGRIDLVWQDRRHAYRAPTHSHLGNGEARMGDTYYANSTDGGNTFSANRRVTDKTQNLDVGYDHYGQIYWSWGPALAHLGNDEILFAWQDSREGNFDNENEDIYLSRMSVNGSDAIPVKTLPATSRTGLGVAMSRYAYQGGSQAVLNIGFSNRPVTRVVVVNEGDTGAALAASVLSRATLGPLLVSPAAGLTAEVRGEVTRMTPIGAYVIGEPAQLGQGVIDGLVSAGVPAEEVRRIGGATAADVAKNIALTMDRRTDAARAAGAPAFDAVVVVNPASREAGTAAGLAASLRLPILFADQGSVPQPTREALSALNITTTLAIGGSGVLSDSVVASLPGARRLGGANVTEVSDAVLGEAISRRLPTNIVYATDSEQPLDAAIVGAAIGRVIGLHVAVPGADPAVVNQILAGRNLRSKVDKIVTARSTGGGPGYRLVARDGGIFAFGGAGFFGSTGAMRLAQPVVGIANTPSGNGYWLVASDGGIFAFGDAGFKGSTGSIRLAQPVVAMASTPSGNGYWLVARDGGVFAFGDAKFFGSTGNRRLAQPVVGIASSPSGNGYWLVAADGGIFAFGDAGFQGSTGALRLAQPMVGMSSSPTGNGYWLVARDGGIFAFGDAGFKGSTGGLRLSAPVVGMDATGSGNGYLLTATDGGVFAFGDAVFAGSTGGMRINQPVVAVAAG